MLYKYTLTDIRYGRHMGTYETDSAGNALALYAGDNGYQDLADYKSWNPGWMSFVGISIKDDAPSCDNALHANPHVSGSRLRCPDCYRRV